MKRNFEIIAECAFSHQGDPDYLLSQVKTASRGQADYIKFQLSTDKKLAKWLLSPDKWRDILSQARDNKIKVITAPLDMDALEICKDNQNLIDSYEIHPVVIDNPKLLTAFKDTKKKIFIGIGGQLPDEIDRLIKQLDRKPEEIVLMTGFQSFPTDKYKANLAKIRSYCSLYRCQLGYADHTKFDDEGFLRMMEYAFLLGASIFEKHLVLEKGSERVDYISAAQVDDFLKMRRILNELIDILGNDDLSHLNREELVYRKRRI